MKYDASIYKGIFVALNACYDKNDQVNLPVMRALARKYQKLGVNGLYLCGSTGEGFLLSVEERMQKMPLAAITFAASRAKVSELLRQS